MCAVVGAAVAVPASRHSLLRAIGRGLVSHDAIEPADIIVVANDTDGAGALEAADLFHKGIALRVAVFRRPPTPAALEFTRRSQPYEDSTATATKELHELGVSSVAEISQRVAGTNDEGAILPSWCREKHYRGVIFITTIDHSRRTRRVLRRAMQHEAARVMVWYSHYSDFDPNAWWQTRNGTRIAIIEYQKLLLDILRHPLS